MLKSLIVGLTALASISAAQAATVTDAANDFLPTYVGPQGGDLDVLTASVRFDGTNFLLSSTHNGAIGTTAGGFYVWGINRGAGTARFVGGTPSVGAGVLFDAVAVLRQDLSLTVVTFPAMGAPTSTMFANAVTISGNSLSALVPLSLLGSTGFAPLQYGFNLWPRSPGMGNQFIADFAPDAATITASVPEPAAWLLMIGGFAMVGSTMRRRTERVLS